MKKLYKFHWDCGRMGELDGIFVEDSDIVDKVIGNEVYFGEVLGKHSEVYGDLEGDDLEILTDDQSFIEQTEDYGLTPVGYNPIQYFLESAYENEPELYEEITGEPGWKDEEE